ncbi:MAG: CCA tRNA nucleotidyltransferase [Clostridium sp.]|jgi:tRNA nucleotidyltransferase (CCA-adding enzyme)|nr:CCA tRNA nucleotidyltransferase [Clostridium sp.]
MTMDFIKLKSDDNFKSKIDSMPLKIKDILYNAGETADRLGYNLYVVGGFVRDLIMGKSTWDIDLVIEGNAYDFVKNLSQHYKGKVTKHEKFQTATIKLNDEFYIDVVTARKEYYQYPGALPTVERGTIKDDLFRRDFTINGMAIGLNGENFGQLVDFYGGKKDLKNKLIRILHNLSFIEDPTRIIRAVRFEKRYGFNIEKSTEEFLKSAIFSDCFLTVSIERINHEFFAILKEKNLWEIMERMHGLGILGKIYPEINYNNNLKSLLEKSFNNINEFKNNLNSYENIDKILLSLLVIYSNMDTDKIASSMEKMRLKREIRGEINRFIKTKDILQTMNITNISNYQAFDIFKSLSLETLYLLTLVFYNEGFCNKVVEYVNKLKNIKLYITGNDLKEMGVEPGYKYKKILDEILKEKLNGNIHTLEDEVEFAKKLLLKKLG